MSGQQNQQLQISEIGQLLAGYNQVQLRYAAEVDSTNEWAKREAAFGTPEGTVYLTDHQTAGKGRRGRVWESPYGTSVSMSILLRPEIPAERLSMLTLVMGLAAAEGIREICGIDTGIKWPNDVVCEGKKLSGILTEAGPDAGWVVIGIGLNVNMDSFPEELRQTAASMRMITGHEVSREAVTAAVIRCFMKDYEVFLRTGDLRGLREAYEALLLNKNQRVRVLDPQNPFDGTATGINDLGELRVIRVDNGETAEVFAGEVSVRGVYGYV